jgi:hypothetical protein
MAMPVSAAAAPREVSVQAGAYAPIFFVYEIPGVAMSADIAWQIAPAVFTDVTATVGALAAAGLRRGSGGVTAGVRYYAIPALWLRLGLGATGYREDIAVDLANRSVRAVDYGAAFVLSSSLGVELGRRWYLDARFDTNLAASRGMDFVGTAMLMVGRRL